MFTGLIEEVGIVRQMQPTQEAVLLTIQAERICSDLSIGDSVAVNGACLTATNVAARSFTALAMAETMRRTNLGRLAPGSPVNLERALRLNDRLGGHLVLGHVDGLGQVRSLRPEGPALLVEITAAPDIIGFLAPKGSVAVDGVSLTIAALADDSFTVALIPHTQNATILHSLRPGDSVNLEADIIGKYVARMLGRAQQPTGAPGISAPRSAPDGRQGSTWEALKRSGYI